MSKTKHSISVVLLEFSFGRQEMVVHMGIRKCCPSFKVTLGKEVNLWKKELNCYSILNLYSTDVNEVYHLLLIEVAFWCMDELLATEHANILSHFGMLLATFV